MLYGTITHQQEVVVVWTSTQSFVLFETNFNDSATYKVPFAIFRTCHVANNQLQFQQPTSCNLSNSSILFSCCFDFFSTSLFSLSNFSESFSNFSFSSPVAASWLETSLSCSCKESFAVFREAHSLWSCLYSVFRLFATS